MQGHVNEASEVYDQGMEETSNNIFLKNIQDGEAQREGLQTAPAGSKKRRSMHNQALPEVNPIDDYNLKQEPMYNAF